MANYKYIIGTLLFLLIFASACSDQPTSLPEQLTEVELTAPDINIGEEGEILFLTRDDFIDPEIYPVFQDENETEVNEVTYGTDLEAISLISSFGAEESYGLVLLSNYAAQVLIQGGYLAELETRNIPNLGEISDRFQNLAYDSGNHYCVPVMWSTTGIAYDSNQTTPPEHWGVLFTTDPASPAFGRISLSNQPREAFAAALMYLGYDVNTTVENEIKEAADIIAKTSASRFGFSGETLPQLLGSRQVALAQGLSRHLSPALESNEGLAYSLPLEGGLLVIDNLCILRTTPIDIKSSAEKFINFILEEENSASLASYNFAASPLKNSRELLPIGTYGEDFMHPPAIDFVPLQLIQPLGAAEQLYFDLFEQVKSGS